VSESTVIARLEALSPTFIMLPQTPLSGMPLSISVQENTAALANLVQLRNNTKGFGVEISCVLSADPSIAVCLSW
jgi:hypothetical protein